MNNRIGVHEAPGLLREGGGVMKKIQSESLSQKLPAVINNNIPPSLIMVPQWMLHAAAAGGEGFSDEQERG